MPLHKTHNDDDLPLVEHCEAIVFDDSVQDSTATPQGVTAADRRGRKSRRRLQGWRFGVALFATTATIALAANFAMIVWAAVHYPLSDGFGIIYEGDCDVVDFRGLWLHVLINGLSSILLGGSNFTMQCLTSPTRRECDLAHMRGDWLDIGVAGVRNLLRISWQRRIFWTLLAVSSVPIHLLYNSAVFKTLGANAYTVVVANPGFLDEAYISSVYGGSAAERLHEDFQRHPTSFETLAVPECISTYGQTFLSGNSHVIAMTNHTEIETNRTVFYTDTNSPLAKYASSWYVRSSIDPISCGFISWLLQLPRSTWIKATTV